MIARFKKNINPAPFKIKRCGVNRRSLKNIFFSVLLGLGTLLLCIFLFYTNWKVNQRKTELTAKITTLKQEVAILEKRSEELKEKKNQMESQEYLEEVARNDLGLKKPGEEVVVVQKAEKQEEEKIVEEKNTWWDWIKSIWKK